MMLAGLGGILDRAVVPARRLSSSPSSSSAPWPRSRSRVFARSRSRSRAVCCSACCRTSLYGYGDTILPNFLNELAGLRAAIPFFLTVILLFVVGRNRGAEARRSRTRRPMEDHRDGLPR